MSNSLRCHHLPHTRLHWSSLFPWVCSNSSPLSQWCHPIIPSSVTSFSSCPQSFPGSGSFPMKQLFASGGQCIGASASASALPMSIQSWSPCLPRDSQESSPVPQIKSISSSVLSLTYGPLSHPYMTTGKTIALTIWTFFGKEMPLLCHSFSSKEQVSFNFMAAVSVHRDFRAQGNEVCYSFHFFPIFLLRSGGTRPHDLCFLNVEL